MFTVIRIHHTSVLMLEHLMAKTVFVQKLVVAIGALDIRDKLIEKTVGLVSNCFEIGVRIEAPNSAFGNILSTHGDLKLKHGAGRTYCVTADGK